MPVFIRIADRQMIPFRRKFVRDEALRDILKGADRDYSDSRLSRDVIGEGSGIREGFGIGDGGFAAAEARAEEEKHAAASRTEEERHPVEGQIAEKDTSHAARAEEERHPDEGEIAEIVEGEIAEKGASDAIRAEEEGHPFEGEIVEENTSHAARAEEERHSAEGEIAEKDAPRAAKAEEEGHPFEGEIVEEDALYKAICDNKWKSAKVLLEKKPNALTSRITASGKTPFHVAALFGHANLVEELLKRLEDPKFLEEVDDLGNTPLLIATVTGSIEVAKCLLDENSNLLGIPNSTNELPATVAFLSGHHEMGRYLYFRSPLEHLQPDNNRLLGPTLLRCCFETQCFDIACHLLEQCQELLFASDNEDWKPIYAIATMNSSFPSRNELVFWKRWIYDLLDIDTDSTPSFESASLPIQHNDTREKTQGNLTRPVAAGHCLLRCLVSSAYNFIEIKKIKELKLLQAQADGMVQLVCKNASKGEQVSTFVAALLFAAQEGNVEFVVQLSKANPGILLFGDNSRRNIFHHAIRHRQDRIFNLIHGLRFKDAFASSRDLDGNTLLHAAASQAPLRLLSRMYGPMLQMQRELQWFEEVEKILPASIKKARNNEGMMAEELFRLEHQGLMKQGEKWIKTTASSCSLIGTLIVTIMFTAAFTMPGGNDQNSGFPLLIKQSFFNVFIFSTIISLVSSSTSVLLFLAILTSHYSEGLFLKSLPTKLILGLFSLFISIVSMMAAFLSTVGLILKHANYSWGLLPLFMLASVPICLFVISQFRLLSQSLVTTYWSILNKKVEQWP